MRAFPLPPSLQPAVSALIQMTPANQQLVINLIQGLADRENVPLPSSMAPGLQLPEEGISLWLAILIDTGLRVAEACSIQRTSINFDGLEIKVLSKGGMIS